VREFFRQIVLAIKEKTNKNLVLNSLIILLKLKYEDFFTVIWPLAKDIHQNQNRAVKSRLSTLGNHPPIQNVNLFDPLDLAINELSSDESINNGSNSVSNGRLDKKTMHSNKFLLTSNAINFLYEAIKCDQVVKLLEK
jgi:hypothetical protein